MERLFMATFAVAVSISQAHAQQACLVVRQIWDWKPAGRNAVVVQDKLHKKFKVTFSGPCPNLEFNVGAAFVSQGNSNLDCLRRGDMLVHRGRGAANECPIASVQLYTPAMRKADEAATGKPPGGY